jgi:hypothetical protein
MAFSACGNRPSNVLSEKKMEDVLFDLYIAETEIRENSAVFSNDSLRKQQLLHSVFKKHRIPEQRFDTSLVWYNAHLDKYIKINNRLTERYAFLIEKLQKEREKIIAQQTTHDTTFLYVSPMFMLQPAWRENIHAFRLDTLRPDLQKKYNVELLAMGIRDSVKPVLTFCIQCNDTNFIHRDTIAQNGKFAKQYSVPGYHKVESIYGNIHLPARSETPVLIGNFAVFQQKTTIPLMDSIYTTNFVYLCIAI